MTIATIDFDIIMSPSIEFYNDLVKTDIPIDRLIDKCENLKLTADMYIYQYLTEYILACKTFKVPIYCFESHDAIIDVIEHNCDEPIIEVINFDHHHDFGYDEKDLKFPINTIDCSNWVKGALDKKLINSYTWIKNKNSDELPAAASNYNTHSDLLKNYNLNKLPQTTDILVLCKSPQWVPMEFHPLYWVWESIAIN